MSDESEELSSESMLSLNIHRAAFNIPFL